MPVDSSTNSSRVTVTVTATTVMTTVTTTDTEDTVPRMDMGVPRMGTDFGRATATAATATITEGKKTNLQAAMEGRFQISTHPAGTLVFAGFAIPRPDCLTGASVVGQVHSTTTSTCCSTLTSKGDEFSGRIYA